MCVFCGKTESVMYRRQNKRFIKCEHFVNVLDYKEEAECLNHSWLRLIVLFFFKVQHLHVRKVTWKTNKQNPHTIKKKVKTAKRIPFPSPINMLFSWFKPAFVLHMQLAEFSQWPSGWALSKSVMEKVTLLRFRGVQVLLWVRKNLG